MIKHKRWLCGECKREWVEPSTGMYVNSAPLTITGNKRNDLCPYCGSGSIDYVQYTPNFLGGDIRDHQLPEGATDLGKNYEPAQRPMTTGFIQNNLIEMQIKDNAEKP